MAEMIRELESALTYRAQKYSGKPTKAFISLKSADDLNTLAFYKRMGFQYPTRGVMNIMRFANTGRLPQLILPVGSYDGNQVRFALNPKTGPSLKSSTK